MQWTGLGRPKKASSQVGMWSMLASQLGFSRKVHLGVESCGNECDVVDEDRGRIRILVGFWKDSSRRRNSGRV